MDKKQYFKLAYGKSVHVNGMNGGGWIFNSGVAYKTADFPPEVVEAAFNTKMTKGNDQINSIEFFDDLPAKGKGKDSDL